MFPVDLYVKVRWVVMVENKRWRATARHLLFSTITIPPGRCAGSQRYPVIRERLRDEHGYRGGYTLVR